MTEEFIWAQKYRPSTINEIILPDEIKDKAKDYIKQGKIPNICFWGNPGMGKSTLAFALIKELNSDYLFYNGRNVGIDTIKSDIESFAKGRSLESTNKVVFIDEADGMTVAAMEYLKTLMEEVSTNCTFLFTSNKQPDFFNGGVNSRVTFFEFKILNKDKKNLCTQLLKRVVNILDKENVTYDKKVIVEVIKKLYPDIRKILSELQKFCVDGKIDVSVIDKIIGSDINELVNAIKEKDYRKCNEWIDLNYDLSGDIYSKICQSLYDQINKSGIEDLIEESNDHQYRHYFVPDKSLNLKAYLLAMILKLDFV